MALRPAIKPTIPLPGLEAVVLGTCEHHRCWTPEYRLDLRAVLTGFHPSPTSPAVVGFRF